VRLKWPLIGRSQEMAVIEAAMSEPGVPGIVVWGDAGVGKSRLAREAVSVAASRAWETRWAIGTASAQSLPLGAFAAWLGSTGSNNAQLVELVRGVIDSLTFAPRHTPVIVAVDDAHLLDDLSAFVVHQIVQRQAAKVVLTIRSGETIPAAVQELWSGARFARLDLQPISADETATLLSHALGGRVDPDAIERLWTLTHGNALYLRNIIEQQLSDGRLAQQHGCWRWTGDPILPASLADTIESRMGALPGAVGDVVDALAVAEPLELTSLIRITDPAAVEEADVRGLITLAEGDGEVEVRLTHPLYGEVRRKRAAATRLRRLRGRIATELAACADREDVRVVVRRATLSVDSDLELDPDLLLRASIGAVWLADLALADRLANAAIRGGAGAAAHLLRAHVLSWLSRGTEAENMLAAVPPNAFTSVEYARFAFLRATIRLWTLADPMGAKQLIDDASQTVPAEAHACIDAFLTVYWAVMGQPEAALKSSERIALDRLPEIAGVSAAWAITLSCGDIGCTGEALAAADAGYRIAARVADGAYSRFAIVDARVGVLLQSGSISDASDAAERLANEAADLPGAAKHFAAAVAGRAALGAGHLDTALTLLEPFVTALSASGETNGWGYRYQIPRTVALALRGSTEAANAALDTLAKQRHPSWRHLDYEYSIAKAWVSATQGAISEAIEIVMSAAQIACEKGQFAPEVMCLQTATQLGERSTAIRLLELEEVVEGPRAGVAARFAVALHAADAAQLAAVSEKFESMNDLVAAADSAAHAAIAYRRQDLRGSALACSTRAEALAERCGGANTPALRQAHERLPLSDREREVVMLLRQGLSSPAIAERLMLSRRTVEGHIYRAMAKTGTTSREELAALIPTRNAPH